MPLPQSDLSLPPEFFSQRTTTSSTGTGESNPKQNDHFGTGSSGSTGSRSHFSHHQLVPKPNFADFLPPPPEQPPPPLNGSGSPLMFGRQIQVNKPDFPAIFDRNFSTVHPVISGTKLTAGSAPAAVFTGG